MKVRLVLCIAGLACLATLLAGCGGGGNPTPGVALTIGGDTAYLETRSPTRAEATLSAPLDEGTVTVYYFATGEVIATGSLDASGFCTVNVTPGLAVAVVITGTRDGKDYRLSTIISQVPAGGGEYVADPVTSIASEAIAQKYFPGPPVPDSSINEVLDAAEAYVKSHPGEDYSVDGGLILGSKFGSQYCLDTTKLQSVIDAVPDITDELRAAKLAVQQIRDAGVPMEGLLSQERPDVEGIFTETVQDAYSALMDRLDTLIGPALFGEMEYNGNTQTSVFDLDPNYVYTAELQTGLGYSWVKLVSRAAGTAGQIKVRLAADGGTYTLTAVQNGSSATVTQKFSGDSLQEYVVNLPIVPEDPGANPSFTGSISLKDKYFTAPLTFTGTASATGPDTQHYSSAVLEGSLATPQVSSAGRFEANFPSGVPAGADPEDTIYDYPTSFSMSNANITVTGGGTTVTLTGSISITTTIVTGGGPALAPKSLQMTGTYSNSDSGLAFDGSITGDWTNAPQADATKAQGSFQMRGDLSRVDHPSYYADLKFTLSGGTADCDIDLRVGVNTLTGTATGTLAAGGGLQSGSMTLENQSGVQFNLSVDASGAVSGNIKLNSVSQATISKSGDLLRIAYKDATFDDFML